jgi:hypothetical protein
MFAVSLARSLPAIEPGGRSDDLASAGRDHDKEASRAWSDP